jgi:Protein of unknown function (DUF551)
MTTPPEVLDRIREEARKAAEAEYPVEFRDAYDGSDGTYPFNFPSERKAHAACYERLKLAEWERERWISVEERLPEGESDEYVNIWTRWNDIETAKREWQQGWKPDHWRTREGARIENEDVTHWKPLPQGPNTNPLDR